MERAAEAKESAPSSGRRHASRRHHHLPRERSVCRAFASLIVVVCAWGCALRHTRVCVSAAVHLATVDHDSPVTYAGSSAHYLKQYDVCGVCDGDTTSCQGCNQVPNSPEIFDACGACANPLDVEFGVFNKTCNDCGGDQDTSGEVYGHKVVDDCGNCRDPVDPLFSRAGIPDYHLGGCVGCDGVPFSGNELDACGVCAGKGCSSSQPMFRSWCCDCAGVPFGPNFVNFCCECVNREEHYLALSDGAFRGPPENHSIAVDLWTAARERLVNGTLELNLFRMSLASAGDTFNRSFDVYKPFRDSVALFKEGWEAMRSPGSNDNSTCYTEVYVWSNATNPRDICGICGGDNSTCLGCDPLNPNIEGDPVPDGGLLPDDCGVCGGRNGDIDDCGICFGDNSTCLGCDGVPNSGKELDGCHGSRDIRILTFEGGIGEVGSGCSDPEEFKAACDAGDACCGCDGVPDSPKTFDGCGECFDQTNENNTHLINATCNGCDGVAYSGRVFDACCVCGGDANYTAQCYLELLNEGENATLPFDPYTMNYTAYFKEAGQLLIDECGECRAWGYYGTTCKGCDGKPGSGLIEDECGVCGGNCSTCSANQTGLPYNCSAPGLGWTGLDRTCSFVRLEGPGGPNDAWVNWTAFPNGTDGNGNKTNDTWYETVNRPGAPDFTEVATGRCEMFLEGKAPPGPRERREWVVKVYGHEEGPFTLEELEVGTITVVDITTGEEVAVSLLPTTLVARVTTYRQQQTIEYGLTSMYQSRVTSWVDRVGNKVVESPLLPGVPNEVVVEGYATELWHGGQFMPMSVMPGMERIIYPYCTGSSWRGAKHRLHGKKLPGNYLGIITTENITDVDGLIDQAWNPLDEYIYDVSTSWIDQQCTCSAEWQYDSQPIAPTCPKIWFPWSGWVEDGWYVSHNTYVNDTTRYSVAQQRSWAGGGWRVSGGWWVQDYGGDSTFGSFGAKVHNAYGSPEDFGYGAMRGPVRLDATGLLTVSTVAPTGGDRSDGGVGAFGRERCYAAARVSQPRRNTSGAIWSNGRENVVGPWTCSFDILVAEPAETCTDVHTVSRSYSETVHTRMHRTCSSTGGDGFAFVIRDDTSAFPGENDVGAPGPGIGYQGLRHSLAVEFDTWHNSLNMEPYDRHVAVHTAGSDPNDAHHDVRIGSTVDVPDFADGQKHRVIISYVPAVGLEAVAAALESGAYKGATQRLSHFTKANPGLLHVYVDDMNTPVLTVPLSMETVLRTWPDGFQSTTAWVGFTSGTGDTWQIVDLLSWNFTSF